jgi:hypothetical protein
MSKRYIAASLVLGICCLPCVHADQVIDHAVEDVATSAIEPVEITTSGTQDPFFLQPVIEQPRAVTIVEKPFSPFTGKVKGKKVRLRASADLEGRVVKELNRQDLLVVVGEKGDFYSVEPPAGIKAYVFRSFVLDGVVEGNRVNVRLEPSLDAPVIGHLNSGDEVKGPLSALNNKWYEIAPPAGTRFYIAKEYIDSVGGPEVKSQIDKRRHAGQQLLDAATLLTQVEMKKSYRDMDVERIKQSYQTVMNEFTEFPDLCDKAKDGFNILQEEYTQRKIAFLEERAEGKASPIEAVTQMAMNPTDRMKMWEPVEESLYLTWSSRNDDRSIDEFYDEQRQDGAVLTGIVEAYTSPVKRKPGDYLLKDKDLPKAYLYSTHVNLQDFVGKKVSVIAVPRTNNNFAFPAYFVLSIE